MLHPQFPLPVKVICAFIYSQEKIYQKVKVILTKKLGKIDFESEIIAFNFTPYYYKEMGQPLFRRFISFQKLQKPEYLIETKLFCMKIEAKFAVEERRIVNIDPGYINSAKLVLATTKDFSHRIYLGKGVFAETTLYFSNGDFCAFPTTFPDYCTDGYRGIFCSIRLIYQKNLNDNVKR